MAKEGLSSRPDIRSCFLHCAGGSMKTRRLISSLLICFLAGCISRTPASQAPADTDRPEKTAAPVPSASSSPEEDIQSVIWAHMPDLGISKVSEFITYPYWPDEESALSEKVGYPQEWDDSVQMYDGTGGLMIKNEAGEILDTFSVRHYIPDAIAVYSDGYWGTADYNGNILARPFLKAGEQELPGYLWIIGFLGNDYGSKLSPAVFLSDFRTVLVRTDSEWGGIGGLPPVGNIVLNGQLMYGMEVSNAVPVDTIKDAHGHNCMLRIVEENEYYDGNTVGYAAFDENARHLFDIHDIYPLEYVNGFCSFSRTPPEYSYEENKYVSGPKAFLNMETGEQITDFIYDEVKWFENGYCPVQRDGKWGFIDVTGKEVTDMIWDDVSALYEGKTYVGLDGTYGVLDLKGTLEADIPVTLKSCYPAGVPEGRLLEKGEVPCDILGAAAVIVDDLNSRKKPGISGELLEPVKNGYVYPVYEIREADGYAWYRIDADRWIADQNGKWVKYTQTKTYVE